MTEEISNTELTFHWNVNVMTRKEYKLQQAQKAEEDRKRRTCQCGDDCEIVEDVDRPKIRPKYGPLRHPYKCAKCGKEVEIAVA